MMSRITSQVRNKNTDIDCTKTLNSILLIQVYLNDNRLILLLVQARGCPVSPLPAVSRVYEPVALNQLIYYFIHKHMNNSKCLTENQSGNKLETAVRNNQSRVKVMMTTDMKQLTLLVLLDLSNIWKFDPAP